MKFFSIYIPDPRTNPARKPVAEEAEAMNRFIGDAVARGEFLSGGGFMPLRTHGAVVRREGGISRVIDGPYAEAKELVGGFAMLQYDSREAAIEGARRFMDMSGDGECICYCLTEEEGESGNTG